MFCLLLAVKGFDIRCRALIGFGCWLLVGSCLLRVSWCALRVVHYLVLVAG